MLTFCILIFKISSSLNILPSVPFPDVFLNFSVHSNLRLNPPLLFLHLDLSIPFLFCEKILLYSLISRLIRVLLLQLIISTNWMRKHFHLCLGESWTPWVGWFIIGNENSVRRRSDLAISCECGNGRREFVLGRKRTKNIRSGKNWLQ